MGTMYKNPLDTQNFMNPETVIKTIGGVKITPKLIMSFYPRNKRYSKV